MVKNPASKARRFICTVFFSPGRGIGGIEPAKPLRR
jgi:hypothetical protein